MRKILYATILVFCAPFLFASNSEQAVLRTVLGQLARANHRHGVAPAAVRSMTSGGAEVFATQWITKVSGKVAGEELAGSYEKVNARPEAVTDFLPRLVKDINIDEPYDWKTINRMLPAARSLIVFSRPAFDSLGCFAFVRADVIPRQGQATTTFYELERQPDDSWKIHQAAESTYENARRTDAHIERP
jgi:hypothetical protein